MKKILTVAVLTAVVAGCGESPDGDSDDTDVTTDTVTTVSADGIVVGNVTSSSFNSTDGTLTVQIDLDGDELLQEYVADGTLDGYSRFTQQDDSLDRAYTAFAGESSDGSLQATVVIDGGQFNRFFGGGSITQNSYSAPSSGLVSYAGGYVGVSNVGPAAANPNGADPSLVPGTAAEVTGSVFINADFTDNVMNGAVYDRVLDYGGTAVDLQTVVLTVTSIEADGSFTGTVEFEDLTSVGSYDGAFGGDDAASVAGVVSLDEGFLDGAEIGGVATTQFDEITGEAEYGVFVIDQCPTGGAECFGTE